MRMFSAGPCEIGGLPLYGTAAAGLFEPPSSSILATASSSKRRSAKRLEDFEIIATVMPTPTVNSNSPINSPIVFEFMALPHFKVSTGPLEHKSSSTNQG
jgi:hypothetical protein